MTKLISGLLATTLASTFAIAAVAPTNAAPMFWPRHHAAPAFQHVQYRPGWRYMGPGRYHAYRGYGWGHRGYGWWLPAAAFATGALVAGALARPVYDGNAHVAWCYDHYRSYRAYDNSWKPLNA